MKINEIFYSIQGEGVYTGLPMVFVRFQGCNLNPGCSYCDTVYARDVDNGISLDVEEVYERVLELCPYQRSWVCITGGEPLFQPENLEQLVKKLKREGHLVTIETNGSILPPLWYTLVESWVADIKCPSSGVCGISSVKWFDTRFKDQIKFVVGTKEDLDFTRAMIRQHRAKSPRVLVSPVMPNWAYEPTVVGGDRGAIVIDPEWPQQVWEFCKQMRVRFSLQEQKVVWGNRKGV